MIRETMIDAVIDKAYAAALDNELWPSFLDSAADLFSAVGISFELYDKTSGHPILLDLSAELPKDLAPEYLEYYGNISPRIHHGLSLPSGVVTYDYAILTEAEMDADEFYNDFHGMQGLRYFVAGHILNSDSHLGVLAAQRSPQQGHVDDAEIDLMQRLMPHVQRAVDLRFRLRDADLMCRSFLDGLEGLDEAAIVLEGSGRVFSANHMAQSLLSAGDGVAISEGMLCFADRSAKRLFETVLDSTNSSAGEISHLRTHDFIAQRPSGERPYLVAIRQLPSRDRLHISGHHLAAIVFIRDPSAFARLNTELLRQSYQLSPAELDIAIALDNGLSLREVAEQRGVSITTVRSQTYALMAKLGVCRQTELVRLLAQYHRPFS